MAHADARTSSRSTACSLSDASDASSEELSSISSSPRAALASGSPRARLAGGCRRPAPRRHSSSSLLETAGSATVAELMRLVAGNRERRASAGSTASSVDALATHVAASVQQAAESYKTIRDFRARLARARTNRAHKKASALLSNQQQPASPAAPAGAAQAAPAKHLPGGREQRDLQVQQQLLQLPGGGEPAGQAPSPGGAAAASLPALTVLVKLLLEFAAVQASPALAHQLRQQLLVQIKSAAAAARAAGQPFSVAAAVQGALPSLQAAVQQACRLPAEQDVLAGCKAKAPAPPGDAMAAVEAALSEAACEAQLSSLCISPSGAPGGRSSMDMDTPACINVEALLQAEMASAISAAL